MDPDAAAYARRTGLQGVPLMRLSGMIRDLKNADIQPELLYLGRGEFLARDGNIHRAVYGDGGLIEGSTPANVNGIEFRSGSGRFICPNPPALKAQTIDNMGIYIVAKAESDTGAEKRVLLENDNWPDYRAGAISFTSDQRRLGVSESPNGIRGPRGRDHYHPGIVFGQFGFSYFEISPSGTNKITMRPGFGLNADSGRITDSAWRDFESGYLGSNKNGSARFNGEISFVLMTARAINKETLINTLVKHEIAGLNPPSYSLLIGDSMTIGSVGAHPSSSRSPQLFVLQDSGWKGSMFENIAQGGVPASGQKEFYQTAINRFESMPDCGPKVIWFWGGYNERGDYDSNTKTRALADQYVAMAADAAVQGITRQCIGQPSFQDKAHRSNTIGFSSSMTITGTRSPHWTASMCSMIIAKPSVTASLTGTLATRTTLRMPFT